MALHPSGLDDTTIAALRASARAAAVHAYAPYSKFRVGAGLLLELPEIGEIVTGCNVENASYRLTTCAEQTAIVSTIARYGPEIRIRAVAIENLSGTSSPPCGACRQMLFEFSTVRTWVLLSEGGNSSRDVPLADLLPLAFRLETGREEQTAAT